MWFTENPWPPILIVATLATALACLWFQRQQTKYLAGAIALALACVPIFFVEQSIVTEGEKIEANVRAMVDHCVRGDADGVLDFVAANANESRATIIQALNLVDVEDDARVTDVEVKLETGKTQATSRFRCSATINLHMMQHRARHPSHWRLRWRLISGKWKVTDIHRLDVVTGEQIRNALEHRE